MQLNFLEEEKKILEEKNSSLEIERDDLRDELETEIEKFRANEKKLKKVNKETKKEVEISMREKVYLETGIKELYDELQEKVNDYEAEITALRNEHDEKNKVTERLADIKTLLEETLITCLQTWEALMKNCSNYISNPSTANLRNIKKDAEEIMKIAKEVKKTSKEKALGSDIHDSAKSLVATCNNFDPKPVSNRTILENISPKNECKFENRIQCCKCPSKVKKEEIWRLECGHLVCDNCIKECINTVKNQKDPLMCPKSDECASPIGSEILENIRKKLKIEVPENMKPSVLLIKPVPEPKLKAKVNCVNCSGHVVDGFLDCGNKHGICQKCAEL